MRWTPLVAAAAAGLCLVSSYVALGGLSYRPSTVQDPCVARPGRTVEGTDEQLQQVVLAAADAAACNLGVSREELVLSMRSVDELEALADERGVSRDTLEDSLRKGLGEAVATARKEGLIGEHTADVLGFAAARLPLGVLLAVLRGATGLLGI